MNKKTIIILFGLVIIALGICFYYTPHWAVSNMKKAAENKDAEALSDYVDFPAFKESLKTNFNAMMASEVSNSVSDNPFSVFGAALATAFINPMIDNLVTPESLAMLMKGGKPQLEKTQSKNKAQSSFGEGETETSMRYDNLNRFVVTVKDKESPQEPVKLIFKRYGIISWKLSALRLPTGIEEKSAYSVSGSIKTDTLANEAKGVAPESTESRKKETRQITQKIKKNEEEAERQKFEKEFEKTERETAELLNQLEDKPVVPKKTEQKKSDEHSTEPKPKPRKNIFYETGSTIKLHNPSDTTVAIYKDESLGNITSLFTNGIGATITEFKTFPDKPIAYKVQILLKDGSKYTGWVPENVIRP